MKSILASWMALAVVVGFSPSLYAESADHTGPAGAPQAGRPAAAPVPLPAEYDLLLKALEKVDSRGLVVKDSSEIDGAQKKELKVNIDDVLKLKKWIGTAKKYREFLTSCAVNSDRSADLLGKFLDGLIAKLQKAITEDPSKASGLSEKELVTYVSQIERFIKEKTALFGSQKSDFEKADEDLLKQLKATVGVFFSGFHESKFDLVRQSSDAETKVLADEMTKAVEALTVREQNKLKVCKMEEDAPAAEKPEKKEETASESSGDDSSSNKKERAALDRPAPLEGNASKGDEEQTVAKNDGNGDKGTGDAGTGNGDTDIPVVGDPNVPFFDPNLGNQVQDFNADDLLRGVLDRFQDFERQLQDQQRDGENRIQDALRAAQDAANLAAQQAAQAAQDAQNADDNGLADALKALTPPPPPPAVVPPPPQAPIPPIATSGDGDRSTPPFFPQQDEGAGQQQGGGMPYPFMPQQQPPAASPIVLSEESSKYDDEYDRRRFLTPQPAINAQTAGMMEWMRIQQQLMFAQQQALMQGQQYGGRANVNSMANRLGSVGGAPLYSRQLPSRANQSSATSSVSGARSSTVPAGIRGSLAR